MAPPAEDLAKCAELLSTMLKEKGCAPIMVRLAWHDSGTYDKAVGMEKWPKCGGANGSIRFAPEINHGANAGLINAVNMLEPVKAAVPSVSYADIYQMASALAIEVCGGPKIDMKYGRVDAASPEECAPEGNLPDGNAPFHDGSKTPGSHLRWVFHKMGLTDQDIVALSGAHTIGRAHANRSGAGKESTKYTATPPGPEGQTPGGSSWTPNWHTFDNSYFALAKEKSDDDLLRLETDACIFTDDGFKPFAEKYLASQEDFFVDYAAAHKKLSEIGSKFE